MIIILFILYIKCEDSDFDFINMDKLDNVMRFMENKKNIDNND